MKKILYILALLILFTGQAYAQFPSQQRVENLVDIELVAAQDAIVPGQPLDIAIVQNISEGWHTYWLNPGDSGAESRFDFKLPTNFEVGEIMWPIPERIPYDILMNFGYEDQAVFLTQIIPPENLVAYHATLTLDANWLVCKDICIPESQTVEITMPVSDTANPQNEALFKNARANLPKILDVDATYKQDGDDLLITVAKSEFENDIFTTFFPKDYGLIKNAPNQTIVTSPSKIVFSSPRGLRSLSDIEDTQFVIVSDQGAYEITASPEDPITALPSPPPSQRSGFFYHVLLALFGGLILNLMPCVFPVLSLKALSVVQLRGQEKRQIVWHGLFYTLGILISFACFAIIILTLRQTGTALGWGFHLQNPYNILLLTYLMTAIGLNLLGVYTIAGRFMNWGQGLGNNKTKTGSFFTGVLAALVATPCTAPFMAAAIGYASVQPALQSMIIILMVGFGLALPYLMLTLIPPLQKTLPRPGAWMETFKKILAIPMFLTAVWLLWVLHQQAGMSAVIYVLIGLGLLTAILVQKKLPIILGGLAVLAILMPFMPREQIADASTLNRWSPEKLDSALATNDPVFVNMTASWCITCKVNEKTTLTSETVTDFFQDNNVQYLVGDWTNEDAEITEYLRSFNRNGVPLYVLYPAPVDGQRTPPVVLPQILTPSIVTDAFTE